MAVILVAVSPLSFAVCGHFQDSDIEIERNDGFKGMRAVIVDSYYVTGRSKKVCTQLVQEALGAEVVKTVVLSSNGEHGDDVLPLFNHTTDNSGVIK